MNAERRRRNEPSIESGCGNDALAVEKPDAFALERQSLTGCRHALSPVPRV
jgi:hypothetical protein